MPSVTSPTAFHFHPYRQVPDSHHPHWQSRLVCPEHPHAHATASYWTPNFEANLAKPKNVRAKRYSVGCTQPIAVKHVSQGLDLDALHKFLYFGGSQPVRLTRARRASRNAIYERPVTYRLPPTPWLRPVPLPHAGDHVSPHTYSSHSRTSSIDSAVSWSPDNSFLQKYAALPICTDESSTTSSTSKGFSQEEAAATILFPELAEECRLKWDVRNTPNGASFRALPGVAFARPDLNIPALSGEIKSLSISFDAPRSEAFKKDWGCILVWARRSPLQDLKNDGDQCYEAITVFDLMDAIFKYFNEQLSSNEIARSTRSPMTEALLKRIGAARLVYTGHSSEGDRYRRVDFLDEFRFRSLKVDTMSGDWCHLHLRLH